MSAIDVKLNVFEGPLDLLLHLIEKNKVNIYDIPIVTITYSRYCSVIVTIGIYTIFRSSLSQSSIWNM